MQKHIADVEFNLPDFALSMGMPESSLYKRIHALTAMSPSSFIRTIRMRMAANMLVGNKSAHIADVAYPAGYGDPKYFSSSFKQFFGVLPSEYRQKES